MFSLAFVPRAKLRSIGLHSLFAILLMAGILENQAWGGEPAFHPGDVWLDTNGAPINAHGGGMLFHEGTYYWFGEHKLDGLAGDVSQVEAVRCAAGDRRKRPGELDGPRDSLPGDEEADRANL